ncbi:hypothetical protein ACQKCU_11665 [Heyndrickxia sporothermodurans]
MRRQTNNHEEFGVELGDINAIKIYETALQNNHNKKNNKQQKKK